MGDAPVRGERKRDGTAQNGKWKAICTGEVRLSAAIIVPPTALKGVPHKAVAARQTA